MLSRLNVLEANSDGISLLLSEMTTNLEETTSDFQDKYDTLSGDINNLSSEQESFMRQVSQALEMTPDGTSLIFTEIQAKIDSIDTDISEADKRYRLGQPTTKCFSGSKRACLVLYSHGYKRR